MNYAKKIKQLEKRIEELEEELELEEDPEITWSELQ
jgi:transcription initiation factor IIE alpha subunit